MSQTNRLDPTNLAYKKRCQLCKRTSTGSSIKCGCGGWYEYHHSYMRPKPNPPATMQTGIQKEGPTKNHGKLWKGKYSDLPVEAKKWKKTTFKSGETDYEYWVSNLGTANTAYTATLKVDGEGVMAHFDGKESVVWNWYDRWRSNFHITDEITKMLKAKKIKSAKLMGELYAVDAEGLMLPLTGGAKDELGMSNSTASIIKTTGDKSTMERQNRIRLAVFDILELNGKSLRETPYEERIAIAAGLVGGGKTVRAIPMVQGTGSSPLQKLWHKGLHEPFFEGLVIRITDTGRTFKVKGAATVDLAVIGYYRGGRAQFTDEKGNIKREGHAGSMSEAIGGLALAFMDKDGNYIYSGNVGTGWKVQERHDILEELQKTEAKISPTMKWGDHYADPSLGPHDDRGRGVMFPVKPTKIAEAQYRGLNWGDRPVYDFKNSKYTQVGTTRAPALFQPSFKRWRDDKELTPQDLRLTQVPPEGQGKWKDNPPNEFTLKPDFTLPEGFGCPGCQSVISNPITRKTPHGGSITRKQILTPVPIELQESEGRRFNVSFEERGAWKDREEAGYEGMPCGMCKGIKTNHGISCSDCIEVGGDCGNHGPALRIEPNKTKTLHNPQSRLDGKEPFRDEIDEKIDYRQSLIDQGYEWYSIPDMPKHSIIYFPRAEIEKFILSIGAKSAKTNDKWDYFVPLGGNKKIREWKGKYQYNKETKQIEERPYHGDLSGWGTNPPGVIVKMPMLERAETKVNHIYRIQGSVFAAQLYTSSASATADQSNYKRICSENLVRISKANPSQIEVTRVERTNICHLKGKPLPETFPGTGSPYIKRDKRQTRSSDEPETLTWECELSGDTITLNPSSKTNILLTVPHAAESPTNPALHLTDYAAMPLANALSGRLKAEGKNAQMIVGEINRSFMDLNRSEATDSAFHQKINNKLAHTDILLDIHSYPTNHPEWGDAQVVLFTSSHYPDEVRKNTMNLANHLASSGIQVLIDGANHQNYIQNKGAANGVKQSDLIEVREDQDLLPIAEAIVEYLCGKPKKNPPEGSIVHALVLRFDLPQVLPFIILKERLEDYGFQVKSWRDKVTGGGGHLSMYLGDAMPRKKSKEDKEGRYVNDLVSIRFQENSQMVLLYGAKHLTEKEQEEIIQKVLNATQFKSNPSPAAKTTKKTIYRPKSLTTSVSRLIMGDLLPQIKSQGKQDKGKQDKGKQDKGKQEKQGDQKNYFNTIKAFAKADGKTHQEIVEEAKNIGTIDTKEKATQFGEALGLDMSKLKLNPNVYAVPQRITGNDGIWVTEDGVDVTGQHFQGKITITGKPRPHIAILERQSSTEVTRYKTMPGEPPFGRKMIDEPDGKRHFKEEWVEWIAPWPKTKYPEPKESGYRIRFNMLKPSRFKAKPKQSQYLISVETKGEHYYTKEASVETILTLATFPTKKSEPRLRPETFGELKLGKKIGTITPTGSKKVHPLYDMIEITPIRQNPIASNVKPTAKMFAHALGIPPKGMKTEDYHVLKSKVDRRMIKRNQEYYFDWELHLKPTGNLTQRKIKRLFPFLRRNEEVPSPKRIPYSIRGSREFYADKLASGVVVLKGTGIANRLLSNPLNAHGKEYLKDHKPMTEKQIKKIFKSEPLDGAVGTQKFLLQLSAKCQNYGEACGYAKEGRLYFKRGHPHLNEARVDGRMMANADAFFHTHPAAWEPSQTSPEDFIVYHGMFTNLGIQDHFTVIADRIDWLHFPKEEKFKAEEMAEVSQEFEKDIVSVFNAAENEFQEKNGNKPIQIVEQTRHINKTLCKAIPEYYAEYKCFEMSPVMILNSKVKKNPPLETYPLNTPYLEDIRPELYEEARMRFNFANELIPWGVRYVDRNDPRIQSKRKSKNTIKASIPVKDPTPLGKRFQEQGDKLDILRSFNAPKEFINAARNYLTGFSGRTSNAHIFLALTLYKEISDAHNVQDGMLNSLSPFIPSGGNGIHKIWLDDQALEDIISLIESDSTIENATAKHGKHAMALALHQIIDGILFSLTDMAEEKIISRWVEANDSND